MLCELRVKNLALIETLELSFEQNGSDELVVMTGETGAGKSIMLRAIHLLSGGRASVDWIRSGESSCEVEALFEVNPRHRRLLKRLEEGGFGSDPVVVLKRVVNSNGRSRYYINGSLATAKIVLEISIELLNVASQHDQQQLLNAGVHLDFIDTLGEHWPLRLKFQENFGIWQERRKYLDELRQKEQEKEQRQDFLRFQVGEITDAGLEIGEDEALIAEKKRLKNSQSLIELTQASYSLLSHELADGLSRLRQNVTQLAALDSDAGKMAEEISDYTFLAEDYVAQLRSYKDSLQTDPYRLDQINERLDQISQLKRKYGESIGHILDFLQSSEEELNRLDSMDREIGELEKEVGALEENVCRLAAELSLARHSTANFLEKQMITELSSLSFESPTFQVHWEDVSQVPEALRAVGWDRAEFYFSANPGEAVKPLARIASGGELSRLLLAMKCLLARKDMVETVIFDEVDSGIGGEAAEAVARKIQELSSHHQVFCITHLPQIAARGSMHFEVRKIVEHGRTRTKVVKLSEEQRVTEVVRMLAGDSATEQTRAWAMELLRCNKRSIAE